MIIAKGSTPTLIFLLVSAKDGLSAVTGLGSNVVVKLSKAGASFANAKNAVVEIGEGWYKIALSKTETDSEGALVVTASGKETLEWRDLHQVYTSLEAHLTAALLDQAADHILRRNFANASASRHGDAKNFRSLLGAVAKDVNRVALNGTTLSIYEANDSDVLGTQSVVTNVNATPIVGIDTDDPPTVANDIEDGQENG